jgi:hypothetical protein
MAFLAAAVILLVVLHVRAYPVVSPFDEIHHIDYLERASRGQVIVQDDDRLTQSTLHEVTCRREETALVPYGVKNPKTFPPCGSGHFDPDDFAWRGYNAAAPHTPDYYLVTGMTARVLRASGLIGSLVTWARLLGGAWLLLGCYLVLRAADVFGLSRLSVALALLLVIPTPALLHATATVNPDASAFVGGAALLLATLAWEKRGGRHSLLLVGLAAFACASLDSTNAAAGALAVGYLAARALLSSTERAEDKPRSRREYIEAAAMVAAGCVVAVVGWELVRAVFTHHVDLSHSPIHKAFDTDSLSVRQLLGRGNLFALFPPIPSPFVPAVLTTWQYSLFTGLAVVITGGAVVAGTVMASTADRRSVLSVVTLGALIVMPPIFVVYNFVAHGVYFDVLPRFGLSLLPAVVLVAARVAQGRVGRIVLLGAAAGMYLSAAIPLI